MTKQSLKKVSLIRDKAFAYLYKWRLPLFVISVFILSGLPDPDDMGYWWYISCVAWEILIVFGCLKIDTFEAIHVGGLSMFAIPMHLFSLYDFIHGGGIYYNIYPFMIGLIQILQLLACFAYTKTIKTKVAAWVQRLGLRSLVGF